MILSVYPSILSLICWSWCWNNRIPTFAANLNYVIHDEKGRIFDVAGLELY